jgi:predicted ester cyclase
MHMSESENAAIIRRWFEKGWNQRNADLINELFAPTFRAEGGVHGVLDRLAYKQYFEAVTSASNDLQCEVVELMDADEYVISKIISKGTHSGTVSGIEATGEFITTEIIDVWKIVDGLIVERRNADFDNSGIGEQINQRLKFVPE